MRRGRADKAFNNFCPKMVIYYFLAKFCLISKRDIVSRKQGNGQHMLLTSPTA